MIKTLIYLLVLILGIPTGLFLSKLCEDEIKKWKKKLIIISGISVLGAILFMITSLEYKLPLSLSLLFIAITNLTIASKNKINFNKKLNKKR